MQCAGYCSGSVVSAHVTCRPRTAHGKLIVVPFGQDAVPSCRQYAVLRVPVSATRHWQCLQLQRGLGLQDILRTAEVNNEVCLWGPAMGGSFPTFRTNVISFPVNSAVLEQDSVQSCCFMWQLFCMTAVLRDSCFVWQLFCMAAVLYGSCFVWQLFCMTVVLYDSCFVWQLFCMAAVLCDSCFVW